MRSERKRSAFDNMKLFEDITRVATGALGSFTEIRHQVKSMVRQAVTQMMSDMDLVTREEFDRVEALARRARDRQEELEKRLNALEGKKQTARKTTAGKKTTSGKKKK